MRRLISAANTCIIFAANLSLLYKFIFRDKKILTGIPAAETPVIFNVYI